jgi:phosphopantetheinyl transferase
VTRRDADTASNDLHGFAADGSTVAAITGWEDRFFTVTPAIHRVVHRTRDRFFSETLALPEDAGSAPMAARLTPAVPADLFDSGFRIWETALAFCILSREERDAWLNGNRSAKRNRDLLLGRAAAKDAVRAYLKERFDVDVAPADVRLEADGLGKPRAVGMWEGWIDGGIDISVAHSGMRAVAVACPVSCGGIGIDLEVRGPMSEHAVEGAFSEDDLRLVAGRGRETRDDALLRLWCAKEALGKALGTGLLGNPRGIRARDWDETSGWATLELTGPWLERFPERRDRPVRVRTWTVEGYALALCVKG